MSGPLCQLAAGHTWTDRCSRLEANALPPVLSPMVHHRVREAVEQAACSCRPCPPVPYVAARATREPGDTPRSLSLLELPSAFAGEGGPPAPPPPWPSSAPASRLSRSSSRKHRMQLEEGDGMQANERGCGEWVDSFAMQSWASQQPDQPRQLESKEAGPSLPDKVP